MRNHFNELRVHIKETKPLARGFDVVFRVFDDGVGFRYEFADQPNLHTLSVAEELTQFNLAQDGTAWWVPAFEWNREEYIYNTTPIREIATAQTPLTVKLADGTHIAFHEAALVDYAGMNIARVQGHGIEGGADAVGARPQSCARRAVHGRRGGRCRFRATPPDWRCRT